jgi:outer membrane protein
MNSLRRMILALFCAVLFGISVPADTFAQNKVPKTAVLDMRAVLRDSTAGKSWQDYYNAKRKEHKDRIAAEEKSVRAAWDELNRQRSILAPQAFQVRERAFRDLETAARGRVGVAEQQLARELRTTQAEVRKVMDAKLEVILEQMIKERGIDIIIAKDDLVFSRKEFDLTAEVIKRLNAALPKLDVAAIAAKAKK